MQPTLTRTDCFWDSLEEIQRSMVRHIALTFDQQVTCPLSAVTLSRTGPPSIPTAPPVFGTVAMTLLSSVLNPDGTFTVTFTVASGGITLEVSGSLIDGLYEVVIDATQVTNTANEQMAATGPILVHRLFGDSDGNRTVDSTDQAAFNLAYRSRKGMAKYQVWFDFDHDDDIDSADQTQFSMRYGLSM